MNSKRIEAQIKNKNTHTACGLLEYVWIISMPRALMHARDAVAVTILLPCMVLLSLHALILTRAKINKKTALPMIAISVKSIELAIIKLSPAVAKTPLRL